MLCGLSLLFFCLSLLLLPFVDRFLALYVFFPFIWLLGAYYSFRIIRVLRGTGFSKSMDVNSRLLSKTYILQISCFTIFLLYFTVIVWLYGFNSIISEYFPQYLSYVAKTSYTYCGATFLGDAALGVSALLLTTTASTESRSVPCENNSLSFCLFTAVRVAYLWRESDSLLVGIKEGQGRYHEHRLQDVFQHNRRWIGKQRR